MSGGPYPAQARELALLVDVLIPGDDLFPPASAAGAQGLLADRLRERLGLDGVDQVLAALATAAGGSLADLEAKAQVAAVTRFQEQEPALFALMLNTLYYSYYQLPLVVQAIRALGIVYNDAPLPLGYDLPPFEPIPGVTMPSEPRGFYFATDEVKRIDWAPAATASDQ
ncbi:MAG: hypothetical protein KC442_12245 [Thermomicrobiales bacterium]|nr:hypothetical protein [Thermomicrobiales bacterium]